MITALCYSYGKLYDQSYLHIFVLIYPHKEFPEFFAIETSTQDDPGSSSLFIAGSSG